MVQRVYDAQFTLATNRGKTRYFVREFYNVKNTVKLSALFLTAFVLAGCAATQAGPRRPWRVDVITSGGFAGRGAGDYAIDSDGKAAARLFNGNACTYTAAADDLRRIEELLANARPREWKESYVPKDPCCDRITYTLTFDEAGTKTTSTWIDDPLPMPEDLVALSNAIVGGDATSIRMQAAERCK